MVLCEWRANHQEHEQGSICGVLTVDCIFTCIAVGGHRWMIGSKGE
jgi:hypothetical protein